MPILEEGIKELMAVPGMGRKLAEKVWKAGYRWESQSELAALQEELESELAAPVGDKCDYCEKHTLGLDGEGKWCTYCGGKL